VARMTAGQRRFAELHVKYCNQTKAYKEAFGCENDSTARAQASKLMDKPHIQAYVDELRGQLTEKTNLEAEDILRELKNIAFSDLIDIFETNTKTGAPQMKPIEQWPVNARRAIAGIKVKHYNGQVEPTTGIVIEEPYDIMEIKFWGKPEVLKLLGARLKLWSPDDDPDKPTAGRGITQIFVIGGQRLEVPG
jgi:phage terminase small subunit